MLESDALLGHGGDFLFFFLKRKRNTCPEWFLPPLNHRNDWGPGCWVSELKAFYDHAQNFLWRGKPDARGRLAVGAWQWVWTVASRLK